MGRGRRFVRTSKGRLGLVQAIGTKPASKSRFKDYGTCEVVENESLVVILHGCNVLIVVELVNKELG